MIEADLVVTHARGILGEQGHVLGDVSTIEGVAAEVKEILQPRHFGHHRVRVAVATGRHHGGAEDLLPELRRTAPGGDIDRADDGSGVG